MDNLFPVISATALIKYPMMGVWRLLEGGAYYRGVVLSRRRCLLQGCGA